MSKKYERKPLFIMLLLLTLLVSSAYAALISNAEAAEITTRQKGLAVLSNVVGVDLTRQTLANGTERNFAMETEFIATTVSIMGVFVVGLLRKKNMRALCQLKPRSVKICGITLGFLLLLVVFLPLVATANATSRAGNVWASRSSGAEGYSSISWRKTDDEINRQYSIALYLVNYCFNAANGYAGFNNKWSNKGAILNQAGYLSNNYDYVAIVEFDHGVGGYPGLVPGGYPNVPDDEEHYMFEDDYGTVEGPFPGSQNWTHGVYDIDMYNAFPPAKVHFAFIGACQSANLYRLYQGFYPATGNPVGLPFAFTHREVSYFPPTGTQMSNDGYSNPDPFPQCYIGFPNGAAALNQKIPYPEGTYKWHIWVENFFYLALNYDISVKDALDMASYLAWQCEGFYDSPLTGSGFTAVWPMDKYYPWGEFEDYTGPASTLAVYGNANIHLKNFQPPDYVTAPSMISGPGTGLVDVSYQFGAYSIDSQGHNIKYRFDWGDGSYTETGWYPNGVTAYENHSWSSAGWFNVKVQARCPNSGWSSWSSPSAINIQNGPIYHWLSVAASDDLGCPLFPNIYIDGNWAGTGCIEVQVVEGWHTILVDDPTWNHIYCRDSYLQGFTDGYGNGESRPIYSSTWVLAGYHTEC